MQRRRCGRAAQRTQRPQTQVEAHTRHGRRDPPVAGRGHRNQWKDPTPRMGTGDKCARVTRALLNRKSIVRHGFPADCERQCLSRLEGCSSLRRRMPRTGCPVSRTTITLRAPPRLLAARHRSLQPGPSSVAVPRPPLLDPPAPRAVRGRAAPAPAPPAVGASPGPADSPAPRPTGGR